jgi:hypothetical protein
MAAHAFGAAHCGEKIIPCDIVFNLGLSGVTFLTLCFESSEPGQCGRKRRHHVSRVFRGPDPEPEHPGGYARAFAQFLAWSENHVDDIRVITPMHVVAYIEKHPGSPPGDSLASPSKAAELPPVTTLTKD